MRDFVVVAPGIVGRTTTTTMTENPKTRIIISHEAAHQLVAVCHLLSLCIVIQPLVSVCSFFFLRPARYSPWMVDGESGNGSRQKICCFRAWHDPFNFVHIASTGSYYREDNERRGVEWEVKDVILSLTKRMAQLSLACDFPGLNSSHSVACSIPLHCLLLRTAATANELIRVQVHEQVQV